MKGKILFVCPTGDLSSGGEASNFELIKYIKNNGYDVFVITGWNGEYNKILTDKNIKNISDDYKWWAEWDKPEDTASQSVQGIKPIIDVINQFSPDVVVTNTFNIPWGALAAAMKGVPHIWIGREFPEGEFAYLKGKMEFIKKFSNSVMANSNQLATFINKNYHFPVGYFYSYVDTKDLKLGYNGNDTRIVSLNGITKRKNQEELIEAASILKKENVLKIKIIFMGTSNQEYKDHLMSIVNERGLNESIEFMPFSPQPWGLVGQNDILVQTSLSESIGRTTIEAMKLGVPVIASDIPGHREAFKLGGGVLYKSGSPKDLADKIQIVLNDRITSRENAIKIAKKTMKTMSEESCSNPFLEAVDSVISGENPMKEMEQIEPYFYEYLKVSGYIRDEYNNIRMSLDEQNKTISY